jgi:hypothetical protein
MNAQITLAILLFVQVFAPIHAYPTIATNATAGLSEDDIDKCCGRYPYFNCCNEAYKFNGHINCSENVSANLNMAKCLSQKLFPDQGESMISDG